MAENGKADGQNVTRLTQDKSLGEKFQLIAGLYKAKAGRGLEKLGKAAQKEWHNSSLYEFGQDVKAMGGAAKESIQDGIHNAQVRVRATRMAGKRAWNKGVTKANEAWHNSSLYEFGQDVKAMGSAAKEQIAYSLRKRNVQRKLAGRWIKNKWNEGSSWVSDKYNKGVNAVNSGIDYVKKAPGRLASWTGRKIRSGASRLGKWFMNTKAGKALKTGYENTVAAARVVRDGAVAAAIFTGKVIAAPVVVPAKAARTAYRNVNNWINEKAEVAARLDAVKNQPNEQMAQAAQESVHTDAVNDTQVQANETKAQKEVKEAVAEQQEKGSTKTEATAEQESASPTATPKVEEQQKPNALKEIDAATLAKIDKERQAMESLMTMNEKSGRPVDKEWFANTLSQELTSTDKKKGFGLTEAQAEAYKAQYPNLFPPKEAQQPEKMPNTNTLQVEKNNEQIKAEEPKTQTAEPQSKEATKSEPERNPLQDLSSKQWNVLNKAYEGMEKDYNKALKAGRPQVAEQIMQRFESRLTSTGKKGSLNLTPEQAAAFKEAHSGEKGVFPAKRAPVNNNSNVASMALSKKMSKENG